jgi:hypothetical protein
MEECAISAHTSKFFPESVDHCSQFLIFVGVTTIMFTNRYTQRREANTGLSGYS